MSQSTLSLCLVVAEGTWLYDGTIPTHVYVLQSDVAFGTGDQQDEPEDAEDRPGLYFYVQWEPAGGGSGGSIIGPFSTVDEAQLHVQENARSVQWLLPSS